MCFLKSDLFKICNPNQCYQSYVRSFFFDKNPLKRNNQVDLANIIATNLRKKVHVNVDNVKKEEIKEESPADLENKILQILKCQEECIQDATQGITRISSEMEKFHQQMTSAKEEFKVSNCSHVLLKSVSSSFKSHDFGITDPSETIDKKKLLIQLYGDNRNFKYQLKEKNPINFTLFRERNFSFSVELYDEHNNRVENLSTIPLSVSLYTSDNFSKIIESNTGGQAILKGTTEQALLHGEANFDKLQIKEVTSHYRNGWVFMVIYAKMPSISQNSNNVEENSDIKFYDIQPLIIEQVVVKAKKMSKKI